MSIQALLISILVTCVTVGATFLYFRNRIQRTEQKIDLMFNLIQEHENTTKLRQQFQPVQYTQPQMNVNSTRELAGADSNRDELINISDDEYDSDDSDDSEEVSDTDEDKITIDNENKELRDPSIKTISLNLEGAETFSKDIKLDEIGHLEEHVFVDDEQNEDEENKDLDDVTLSDDGVDNTAVTKDTDSDVTMDETNLTDLTDYSKLNKKKLVEIANEKGMNTKGLRKSALVELLNESE